MVETKSVQELETLLSQAEEALEGCTTRVHDLKYQLCCAMIAPYEDGDTVIAPIPKSTGKGKKDEVAYKYTKCKLSIFPDRYPDCFLMVLPFKEDGTLSRRGYYLYNGIGSVSPVK